MAINGIEVTEVQVRPIQNRKEGSHLEAFARVVLNGGFAVSGIRVVKGKYGNFVSFPEEYNAKDDKRYPVCNPVTREMKAYLSERILNQFELVAG